MMAKQLDNVVIVVAIQGDCNIRKKGHVKLEKHQGLKEDMGQLWKTKASVVPVVFITYHIVKSIIMEIKAKYINFCTTLGSVNFVLANTLKILYPSLQDL